ncbi:hypothetical protein [Duganella aceris]|uniref:hypothetical protein n=1 Tax=Duganella aceris TaxID=2703883 RepID=UPI00140B8B6B|nr:hypothetical protein [Duganella aceris]
MEYRFSLTPRLIALAIFSGVALMVLLFALGYQVGQGMAREARPVALDAAGNPVPTTADKLADDAERRGVNKLRAGVNAAVPPAMHSVQKAAQ